MRDYKTRDLLTGLFVIVTAGVALGALVITSGLLETRQELYLRASTAQDLTTDTRVLLQGLEVGRVSQISASLDSSTGALTFIARLSLIERFPDGAPVVIPVGTKAVIEQTNPIAPAVVQLIPPQGAGARAFLQPGDTIASERRTGAVDELAALASELGDELRKTLEEARTTMVRTARATGEAERLLAAATPRLTDALEKLTANLERTDAILAEVGPRIGPIQDSLIAVLSETRRVLQTVERLAADANTLVADNDVTIRDTVRRLHRSAVLLEHFATQVSRRPTRLLTGVRPPPPDTTEERP
ncbi:MAG: hypothetical protein KatS3mg081_0809 [Gemmatimonadales bacterium]|nr:hypothetical protein HRbin33_00072 [bacterium HR33]GIW51454.1 MAG: hypothetical protein KatS3mg081_0809 [Gemmatimonadales bacterium]